MKNNLALLCFLFTCLVFWGSSSRAAQDSSVERTIMESIANNDYQKALTLLNDVINKNPGNTFALGLRSQVFLQLGKVDKSLDDIDTILEKDITTGGMLLYRCVIKETQTKKTSDAMECYAAASQVMEQIYPQSELIQNGDYIKLLILAGSPKAEKAREEHMAYLQTDEARKHELPYIKEFDRSKIKTLVDAILAAQGNNRAN